LPDPSAVADDPTTVWKPTTIANWYGSGDRTVDADYDNGTTLHNRLKSRRWSALVGARPLWRRHSRWSPPSMSSSAQKLVPSEVLTEGLNWTITALGVGAAVGAWTAGLIADSAGGRIAFLVAVVASWAAVIMVAWGRGSLHAR
jgi:hypothetical protein